MDFFYVDLSGLAEDLEFYTAFVYEVCDFTNIDYDTTTSWNL